MKPTAKILYRDPANYLKKAMETLEISKKDMFSKKRKQINTDKRAAIAIMLLEKFGNEDIKYLSYLVNRDRSTLLYYKKTSSQIKEVKFFMEKIKNI